MNELWQRILAGAESIGTIFPALIGAGVILLTGYFLARQMEKWTDHLLKRMEFNKVAEAGGLTLVESREAEGGLSVVEEEAQIKS